MIIGWAVFKVFDAATSAVGWAFDKVIQGIYEWIANGLVLLLRLVWSAMDRVGTPRVSEGWFANGLFAQLSALAGGLSLLMLFVIAIQAAMVGRPELIGDAARHWLLAWFSTVLFVTLLDAALVAGDEAAALVWSTARPDLSRMTEVLASVARTSTEGGVTFVMPAMEVFTIVAVAAMMFVFLVRGASLYLVAAVAPLIFAGAVHPSLRPSRSKLIQIVVALVFAKLAMAIALSLAAKLIASAADPGQSPEQQLFTVAAGAVCFLLGAVAPWLLYRLIPIVEHAAAAHGLGSTMFRGTMTATQVAMTAASAGRMAGASAGRSPATRPIPGGDSGAGPSPGSGLGGQTPLPDSGAGPAARPIPTAA